MKELSQKEMSLICGGVEVDDFCAALDALMSNIEEFNELTEEEAIIATDAWNIICVPRLNP